MDLTAAQFNERHPIGTPVIAYPWIRPEYAAEVGATLDPDDRLVTRTGSAAWNLGHGIPVVAVDGHAGGIALTHIDLQEQQPDPQPDRCPGCLCGDCGGTLDQHSEHGCTCDSCERDPALACRLAEFEPDPRIQLLALQLAPLLSAHLNTRARDRCLAVAHTAHHFLRDYDTPGDPR